MRKDDPYQQWHFSSALARTRYSTSVPGWNTLEPRSTTVESRTCPPLHCSERYARDRLDSHGTD
uniref:Uncharacterized protein n=1 Tax=Heterorhabditis bacteriophora TaxID=37862 RepID=A0A1I7X212_HETBA